MPDDREHLIRELFAAYLGNDRQRVADALADDFRSPVRSTTTSTRRPISSAAWRDTGWIARHDIERIFVRGDEAFVTYLCLGTDGRSFRNAEFFTFAGGTDPPHRCLFRRCRKDGRFLPQPR